MNTMKNKAYYKLWGKANRENERWHPLVCHMLDVAAVAREYVEINGSFIKEWCGRLHLREDELLDLISFFAAIHDLGKFDAVFQLKIPELAKMVLGISGIGIAGKPHTNSAWLLWEEKIKTLLYNKYSIEKKIAFSRTIEPLLSASFGHHGRPVNIPSDKSPNTLKELYGNGIDEAAVQCFFEVLELFPALKALFHKPERLTLQREMAAVFSFVLSGIIILSDWTASDPSNFRFICDKNELRPNRLPGFDGIEEYYKYACENAVRILENQGLVQTAVRKMDDPWKEISDAIDSLRGKEPSPLQYFIATMELPVEPTLYIIEDAAGSGKTEAALMLAARLMGRGDAEGFYFGLPTMATSNGMYDRLAGVYKIFFENDREPSLILAHGGSGLHAEFSKSILPQNIAGEPDDTGNDDVSEQETSAAACNEWIADRSRKAFLSQVGVGSIDQAMLAVIYSRHNTLRMTGLSRRILIIDEVHAYDMYMQKILQNLVEFQGAQHKSVILLSATLPSGIKHEFEEAYKRGLNLHEESDDEDIMIDGSNDPYPLVTISTKGKNLSRHVEIRNDNRRTIKIKILSNEDACVEFLKSVSQSGRCGVWIRNTVSDVQNAYDVLCAELGEENVLIFHSRYAMAHRQKIESEILRIFGKESGLKERQGKILVASQVVEQSLDLDFDEMISDLCPIDLAIQRAGRLRRHQRDKNGNIIKCRDERGDPVLYVFGPDPDGEIGENWYSDYFPKAKYVYKHPGILWRTAKILKDKGEIQIPACSRSLVEWVYNKNKSEEEIPHDLKKASKNAKSGNSKEEAIAVGNLFPLYSGFVRFTDEHPWSDSSSPTRLSEDTETYRLCLVQDGELVPLVGTEDHPWQMSEVKYSNLHIGYNDKMQALLDKTNKTIFDKGRGGLLLPVEVVAESRNDGHVEYISIGLTLKGKHIMYSEKKGLYEEA